MYQDISGFVQKHGWQSQPRTGCKNVKESISNSKTNMKYRSYISGSVKNAT